MRTQNSVMECPRSMVGRVIGEARRRVEPTGQGKPELYCKLSPASSLGVSHRQVRRDGESSSDLYWRHDSD